MSGVTKLGLALILVFVFFLVALVAEFVYVLWYRRRSPRVEAPDADDRELAATTSFDGNYLGARPKSKELLLYLFCWKNQSRIEPTPAAVSPMHSAAAVVPGFPRQGPPASTAKPPALPPTKSSSSEAVDEEMAKWRCLYASRVLFTIREEDKEGAESDGGSTRIVTGLIHVSGEKSADGQLEQAVILDVEAAAAAATQDTEYGDDHEEEEGCVVVEDPASHFTPFSTPCASPPFYTPSPSPPRWFEAGADIGALAPDADWSNNETFSPAEDINRSSGTRTAAAGQ